MLIEIFRVGKMKTLILIRRNGMKSFAVKNNFCFRLCLFQIIAIYQQLLNLSKRE